MECGGPASALAALAAAPPLRGLRADSINQRNVIIRLYAPGAATQKQHYVCEHEHNV